MVYLNLWLITGISINWNPQQQQWLALHTLVYNL